MTYQTLLVPCVLCSEPGLKTKEIHMEVSAERQIGPGLDQIDVEPVAYCTKWFSRTTKRYERVRIDLQENEIEDAINYIEENY